MNISKKFKFLIPVIVSLSIVSISLFSFSPISVSAENAYSMEIPKITGTIEIADPTDRRYSEHAKIAFSVAMAIAENSVTDSTAMIGKLEVLQGYLVYKIPVMDSNKIIYYTFVDAGNGELLFVSEGFSEEQIKARQLSLKETQQRMKEAGIEMSIEEIEEKRRQGEDLRNAFFELPLEDKATILSHLAMARLMPQEQQEAEKEKLIAFIEELVTVSHEQKIQKMKEFADSLR